MKVPNNTQLFETPISTHWFDENRILCNITKGTERKIEYYHKLIVLYNNLTNDGDKLCILTDLENAAPLNKEISEFINIEWPKYIKAIALISNKPMMQTHTSTFLKLGLRGYPILLFPNEKEAKEWLLGYL